METLVQQPKEATKVATPAVSTQTTPPVQPAMEAKPEDSFIKRVSQKSNPTPTPGEAQTQPPSISITMEDVKDPIARQILEKKMAEANKGISEAFGKVGAEKSKYIQEVDKIKSELEKVRRESNQPWTPQRLQQELNKQDFVQSATTLQSQVAPQGMAQETWSALTPEEKQSIVATQQKTTMLEQQLAAMQQSQVMSSLDSELKQEYPDYEPSQIREFYQKAQSNQISTKDMLKSIYYATNAEKLISRAYELGRQDRESTIKEKITGISPMGINATPTTSVDVEHKPGERSSRMFSQHAYRVLEMIKNMPKKQ
jgi:hypothetical protein